MGCIFIDSKMSPGVDQNAGFLCSQVGYMYRGPARSHQLTPNKKFEPMSSTLNHGRV